MSSSAPKDGRELTCPLSSITHGQAKRLLLGLGCQPFSDDCEFIASELNGADLAKVGSATDLVEKGVTATSDLPLKNILRALTNFKENGVPLSSISPPPADAEATAAKTIAQPIASVARNEPSLDPLATIAGECTACGKGFAEDGTVVGGRLTTVKCRRGHEGPLTRIASAQAGATAASASSADLVAEVAKLRTMIRQELGRANDAISSVSYSELAKFQLASLEQKRAHVKLSEVVGPPVLSPAEQEALWGEPSCEHTEVVMRASKMEGYLCMKMTRYLQRLFDDEDVLLVNSEETKWIEALSGDRENFLKPDFFLLRKGLQVNSSETGSTTLRMFRGLGENSDVTYSFGKPCHWCLRDCVLAVVKFKVKLTVEDFGKLVSYLQHMSRGDSESTFCGMVCDNSDVWLVACIAGETVSRIDTTWTTKGSLALIRQFFLKPNPWCCVLDRCFAMLAVKPIADNSLLGCGAKARVFTVVAQDGRRCAMKIVYSKNEGDIAVALMEVVSLKAIKKAGGNVVTIVGELAYYRDPLSIAIHGVGYLMEEVGTPVVAEECRASPTLIEEVFHQLHHLHRLRRYHGDARLQNIIRYNDRLLWIDFMRVNVENPSGVDFVEFVKHDSKTLLQSIFGQVPDGVLPALQAYADSPSDDTIGDFIRAILAFEV